MSGETKLSARLSVALRFAAGFALVVALWWIGSLALGPDVLPDPIASLAAFTVAMTDPEFLTHGWASLWRLSAALGLAVAAAFPLGLLFGRCPAADWLGAPTVFITLPLPKIVLLPVFFTALGLGDASRILLIALAAGYQILVIVREAALTFDPACELALRSMGATAFERFRHAYLPAALPSLFVALKAASGTAVAVLFLAESFATDSGLGYFIMNAWGLGDIDGMFVGILGMSLLGVAVYAAIALAERLCCPWVEKSAV